MIANAFIAEFDEAAHEAFADAGLADEAQYTPPGGGAATPRRVYVNTAQQTAGEFGQVVARRTVVGVMLADGAVAQGGALAVGSSTYKLQRLDETNGADGSLEWWVVTHG